MKRYHVIGSMTVSCWTVVEANSPEEAVEIAEGREAGQLTIQAIYPDDDECFHFESDGIPENLRVEGE